jgi:hypothetical protein
VNPADDEFDDSKSGGEAVSDRPSYKTDPSRLWFRILVALGILGLLGAVAARPAYRVFKDARATTLLPQATAAFEAGDLETAGKRIRVLVGLTPRRPDVMRLTARYCARVGNPDGLNYWNFLLATPEATREDRVGATAFALALNRLDISLPILKGLLAANPTDPDALRLLTRHFLLAGDAVAMRSTARQWLQAHPTENEAEFVLGSALLGAPDDATRSEGSRLLWGLAVGGSKWGEAAATALSTGARLTASEAALLLRKLSEKPETRLAAERLRLRIHPDEKPAIVERVASWATATSPLPELAATVAWLAEAGAADAALRLLPAERARTNAALLSVRLQILLEQKRFADVETAMSEADTGPGRVSLQPYVLSCLKALKARQEKSDTDIGPLLDNALAAAGNDPRALAFVADYAEYLGGERTALNAHMRRLEWPPALLGSANEALRLARRLGDEAAVHRSTRRLAEALPGDTGLRALEAYQAALLREPPLSSNELLSQYQRANAGDPLYRAALALVDLRAGRHIEALALMEGNDTDWSAADPRWQAVYVAALSANQQREAARTLARQIKIDELSPSERALLEAAR